MKEWKPIIKLLIAAAAIILLYDAFIRVTGPRQTLQVLSDGERAEVIAERYLYGPTPDAVLVGSSMARRLGYGDDARLGPEFYNLGIDGAGPLTGLALILAKKEKPRIVVVETNWLQRPLDTELIGNATAPQLRVAGFRQEFKPIGLIKAASSGRLNPQIPDGLSNVDNVPDADPETISTSLRSTIPRFGTASDETLRAIDGNAAALRKQVTELEAQSVRVVLSFLPMHAGLEHSPAFEAIRDALRRSFPPDRFEWLNVPGQYHTTDSIHLTAVSAVRFTKVVRSATSD